jgi:ankyrin repeat protein
MEVGMTEDSRATTAAPRPLPDEPSLDWLKKQAKRQLAELRKTNPDAQLSNAQLSIAREYGFSSWRALKSHIDSLTIDGMLVAAARAGNVKTIRELLDEHPEKVQSRSGQYKWTPLHVAARHGQLRAVNELIERGADVNAREEGDNTYPMHWAAAAGHLDVVRRLADAGGDVVGHGDDHAFEVIGWASCWDGGDDAAHRDVVDFLISRGARHHIFSAIALDLADEARRIVAENPAALASRLSRNENNQTPLHFAVGRRRAGMVALLTELGADILAVDGWGMPVAAYAVSTDIDRPVMNAIHALTLAEIDSANRGHRAARGSVLDLLASVAVGDWKTAERLLADSAELAATSGPLHISSKRGDLEGVRWLLDHDADPSARWAHWDSDVTPLHLAILANHPKVARLLLDRGADPGIRDTKHDSDALGWARFFQNREIEQILSARSAGAPGNGD